MVVPVVSVTYENEVTYFPSSHITLNLLWVFFLLKGLFGFCVFLDYLVFIKQKIIPDYTF